MELVAVLAFWWNPVTWWACRRLRAVEEQCCDDLEGLRGDSHELARRARGFLGELRRERDGGEGGDVDQVGSITDDVSCRTREFFP